MHSLGWRNPIYITSFKTSQKHGGIHHRVTSPTNAQSNGQAECFVQTIKNSLTKAIEGGEDPHLAILACTTTPLNHSLPSPAELLNSRKYRCILPVQDKQQNLTHKYRNIMQKQKQQQINTTETQGIYPVLRLEGQSMYNWS